MFPETIEDFTEDTLQFLIDNKVQESYILDYKKDLIEGTKLAKAVACFANTKGGKLILGVEVDKDDVPIRKTPISFKPKLKEQISQTLRDNISPPIDNILIKIIPAVDITKCFVLIQVPQTKLVHGVVIKKKTQYFKRMQFECRPVDYYEIKHDKENISRGTFETEDITNLQKIAHQKRRKFSTRFGELIEKHVNFDQSLTETRYSLLILFLAIAYLGGFMLSIPLMLLFLLLIPGLGLSTILGWAFILPFFPLVLVNDAVIEIPIVSSVLKSLSSLFEMNLLFSDIFRIAIVAIDWIIFIAIAIYILKNVPEAIKIKEEYFEIILTELTNNFTYISFSNFSKLVGINEGILEYWEIDPELISINKDNYYLEIKGKTFTKLDINKIIINLNKALRKAIELQKMEE